MHYRNERNLTAMLSHPAGARRFVQPSFQVPVQAPLVDIFSPGLGNDEPERTKLGQSLARTDKFISAVEPFYRSRNKELRVYGQQSAYGVKT